MRGAFEANANRYRGLMEYAPPQRLFKGTLVVYQAESRIDDCRSTSLTERSKRHRPQPHPPASTRNCVLTFIRLVRDGFTVTHLVRDGFDDGFTRLYVAREEFTLPHLAREGPKLRTGTSRHYDK